MVESADALPLLLRRARNSLWLWRIRQTLWSGLYTAALVVAGAGFWHVLRAPVALHTGLLLALVGPALAVCYSLIWQRPDPADAAAALDRRGNHQDLFVSSWEAYRMPPERRCAGAVAVLQQVATLSTTAIIPADWSTSQRWFSRLGFLPWAVVLSGLFLLQLPGAQAPPGQLAGAAGAGMPHEGDRYVRSRDAGVNPAGNSTRRSAQAELSGVAAARPQPGQAPPEDIVTPEGAPGAVLQEGGLVAARNITARSTETASASGKASADGSRTGALAAGQDLAVTTPPARDEALVGSAVEFVDIVRRKTGSASYPAARAGGAELAGPGADGAVRALRPAGLVARPSTAPADGRQFSLRQRQHIATYFERIQELP